MVRKGTNNTAGHTPAQLREARRLAMRTLRRATMAGGSGSERHGMNGSVGPIRLGQPTRIGARFGIDDGRRAMGNKHPGVDLARAPRTAASMSMQLTATSEGGLNTLREIVARVAAVRSDRALTKGLIQQPVVEANASPLPAIAPTLKQGMV